MIAANAGVVLVGAHHHGHRVPADEALDPPLNGPVAGIRDFFVHRNRVDIRSFQTIGSLDPVKGGALC